MFIFCNDIYSKKITINNSFQNVDGNWLVYRKYEINFV